MALTTPNHLDFCRRFNGAAAKSSGKFPTTDREPPAQPSASMGPPLKAAENLDLGKDRDVGQQLQWGRR